MDAMVKTVKAELISPDSFESLVERFLSAEEVAQSSKYTYRRQLRQFRNFVEYKTELSSQTVAEYKKHLLEDRKLTPLTVSGYLTAVRKFFAYLEAEKIYPNIVKVKSPKKPKGFRKDCLSENQIRTSLDNIRTESLKGLRDFALFNLLVRTGLRTIEAVRATVGDVRQESGQAVLWIQGKGRNEKDDFVILTAKTINPIQDYLEFREKTEKLSDDSPLFASDSNRNLGEPLTTRSVSRIIKEALRTAGNNSKRLSAHSLRHTAITLSIVGGATLQQVQAMARHADPKTTMVYLHNLNRVQSGAEKFIDF